jgi:hypothetical protein
MSELITALLLNQLLGSNYFTRKQEAAEQKKTLTFTIHLL